jgi:hypothetical protein
MACRPGLLRGGRSLRDVYVPSVGATENPHADQREAHGEAVYTSRSDRFSLSQFPDGFEMKTV